MTLGIKNFDEFYKDWEEKRDDKNKRYPFELTNHIISSFVNISTLQSHSSLTFINCVFNENIQFKEVILYGNVNFHSCTFNKGLSFYDHIDATNYDFNITKIIGSILVRGGNFNNFFISGTKSTSINVNGGEFKTLRFNDPLNRDFKSIAVNISNIKGYIYFRDTQCETLNFTGTSDLCSINIENCKVEDVTIYNFKSKLGIVFNNLLEKRKMFNSITIRGSSIGQTEFRNQNFLETRIEITDSQIMDCILTNNLWDYKVNERLLNPQKFNLSGRLVQPEVILSNKEKTRDVYRQLKHSMNKIGDSINEGILHKIEMETYYDYLSWGKNFWDKSILYLSKKTSDFGQSISKPVLSILIINPILFILLILLWNPDFIKNCYITFEFTNNFSLIDGIINGFVWILRLSNPFDKIDSDLGGFWFPVIVIRIWTSYMIYNFIRASRRFIK